MGRDNGVWAGVVGLDCGCGVVERELDAIEFGVDLRFGVVVVVFLGCDTLLLSDAALTDETILVFDSV